LIGDACSTICPTGGGLRKALTDIESRVTFPPRWLARARSIDAADIALLQRVSEANALRTAEVSCTVANGPDAYWEARRQRNYYGARVQSWFRRRPSGARKAGMGTM